MLYSRKQQHTARKSEEMWETLTHREKSKEQWKERETATSEKKRGLPMKSGGFRRKSGDFRRKVATSSENRRLPAKKRWLPVKKWRLLPKKSDSADDWWSSSARYGRAVCCRHLYTRTASLNLMHSGTFSQCNCVRSGVKRSYLDAENTSRAAEFITDCICLMRWDGMPASVALP